MYLSHAFLMLNAQPMKSIQGNPQLFTLISYRSFSKSHSAV